MWRGRRTIWIIATSPKIVLFWLKFIFHYCFSFEGQSYTICPTAVWNQTFRTVAGIINIASSTATTLYYPIDLYYDSSNTLFVGDHYNHRIQRFASGSASGSALSGLSLSYPSSVGMDSTGAIYVLDTNNYRVMKWVSGVVTVAAGGRGSGSSYDRMSTSYFLFIDPTGNIYVSDYGNHRVVMWPSNNPNMSQLVTRFMCSDMMQRFSFLI